VDDTQNTLQDNAAAEADETARAEVIAAALAVAERDATVVARAAITNGMQPEEIRARLLKAVGIVV
jgi:hypothetical protein